jgi:FAD:protein FMN transferase
VILSFVVFSLLAADKLQRVEVIEPHMGTMATIRAYAASQSVAKAAITQAFARIRQLDEMMSDYNPASEVSRLTTGKPIRVSPELFAVLEAAQTLSAETEGAFDVTIGALTTVWRQARKEKRLLTDAEREQALQASGYQHLKLDKKKRTVQLLKPGMRIDLGGIAKGYAAMEALRILRKNHCPSSLVSISGDIAIGDPPPDLEAWLIEVEPAPGVAKLLQLANRGVSTSGDREQFLEVEGKRYSHILDPRTGHPLTNGLGISVVAANAMLADGLATAICVLGKDKAQQIAESHNAGIYAAP